MRLSVIIVNYNVRPFLGNALVSVRRAMTGIDGEVIVVDNASDDGSVEMLRNDHPGVVLILNERNRGFGAANNQAMRAARGDVFILLNPDTVVQEDTFRTMAAFFDSEPGAGIAGCRVLNPDGTLQLACRRSFPTPWVAFTKISGLAALFPRSPLFARYNLTYRNPDETYEVDAVSGSFMALRREVFERTGGFDEEFFMYGEDLDWCYRAQQAGWKIFYVHSTQIIHYKGESARRSDIDEVGHFYLAMRLFVRKHFRRDPLTGAALRAGIALREWIAFCAKLILPLREAVLDAGLVILSLCAAELIRFGEAFHFPAVAYRVVFTVPPAVIVGSLYSFGAYTAHRLSFSRSVNAIAAGYVFLSALTFFFNQYAYSRMVVLISGAVTFVLLPGWRLAAKAFLRSPEHRRHSLFGRRTLIVGPDASGLEVLRKLRSRVDDGYEVVGFVDTTRKRVGEKVEGVEILGSIDNIAKVIHENKVSEVIFSTEMVDYTDILAVIARTRNRSVNFRLVPGSLGVIIGKTHIDELDAIPLVDIEHNLHRPMNRLVKRTFDIVLSALLLAAAWPFALLRRRSRPGAALLRLPDVLFGSMSLVGPPPGTGPAAGAPDSFSASLGKPGLTGLVQVNYRDGLTAPEIEQYNVYYAKNQSFLLDIEILLKSLLHLKKN